METNLGKANSTGKRPQHAQSSKVTSNFVSGQMDRVTLEPMTEPEFRAFLERTIPLYAAEKVLAGSWPLDESLARSEMAYAESLPDGLETVGHYLFSICQGEVRIGMVWLADDRGQQPDSGFIYELYIEETFRRQGMARTAMRDIENRAREMGIVVLRLHVFGGNAAARALYEDLGYSITDISMAKTIAQPEKET